MADLIAAALPARIPGKWLVMTLFPDGLTLMLFSQVTVLTLAIPSLTLFSLCVRMSEGATCFDVSFINWPALRSVSGIVGAGGNAGAVAAGFLFKTEIITWSTASFIPGAPVAGCSFLTFAVNFSTAQKRALGRPSRQPCSVLSRRQSSPARKRRPINYGPVLCGNHHDGA